MELVNKILCCINSDKHWWPGLGRNNAAKDFCVILPFTVRDQKIMLCTVCIKNSAEEMKQCRLNMHYQEICPWQRKFLETFVLQGRHFGRMRRLRVAQGAAPLSPLALQSMSGKLAI